MSDTRKKTFHEQEKLIKDKIEKEREKLQKLQAQRKSDIGTLACKYNLHLIEDEVLEKEFKKLAENIANVV